MTAGTKEGDGPSVIGQEAHVISEQASGPRHRSLPDYDVYENLILLCGDHHKPVDDQVNHYTEEKLQTIKQDHEQWVNSLDDHHEARLILDPTKTLAKKLRVITTGIAMWHLFDAVMAFYPSFPEDLTDVQHDLVAAFLDELRDWIDISSAEYGYKVGRDAAKMFGEHIKAIMEANMLIGVRERHLLLTGGVGEPSAWRALDVEIQPLDIAEVVNADDQRIWPPPRGE